jgi:hypothetical protein
MQKTNKNRKFAFHVKLYYLEYFKFQQGISILIPCHVDVIKNNKSYEDFYFKLIICIEKEEAEFLV